MLAVVALALVWGYTWVVLKVATSGASPFVLVAMRMVLGAASLFALAALSRKPLKSPPAGPTALIGICQVTLMSSFQVLALSTGGAGKTALLVYTFPFWIPLLSFGLLDERLTRGRVVAIVIAAIGLAFVLYPLDFGHDVLSKVFALASAVSWAFGSIFTKRFRAKHDVDLLPFTAWQMAYGAIPVVILALAVPGGYVHFTPAFITALAYIVIFGSAIAFWLWFFIMERLSAVGAGIASLLVPVVGVLAAWIQLHERPGRTELIGMVLIVIALAINSIPPDAWARTFGRGARVDFATGPR
ncbi:MAG TPA: EamA family transporter [Candidatus Lustribacter sp.]|nr:EamA family transporter [Candidatus Lustribacter sp.]